MANTVIALKKSATPTAAPVSLANGEIAINYADGIIYYKAANGSIASISSGTASFGTVNAAGTLILADMVNDVLDIRSGNNIEISGDAINDRITITANLAPAFDKANSANVLAFNTGIGANAWANSIGTAGNNYTISVGAASNTWANSIIGPSANSWANTKLSNTSGVWFDGNLNISQDLYIGNNITNVTSLIFNTGTNRTPIVAGELTWSQDDSTLHFNSDTPGSAVIHIGQDLVYLVKNQTGSTIYKGNVCMFAGTVGASGRLLIQKAIANNAYPSKYVIGVAATNISNGDDGIVIGQGKVRGIDTSMFSQGDILYLSSTNPGAYSNVMPTAPNNKVTMAAVIYKDSSVGSIMVRPTLGSKLNEDELAELNGLADGDLLRYKSANGRFENFNENSTGPAINAVAAFAKANAANVLAFNTGIGANAWANAVGTAGNNYTNTVGVAGNNYTIQVGAASNTWANNVGTAGNNYTNAVGTAGNNYTNAVGVAGNNYSVSIGAASNTWANNVGTAGNNYTNSVGVAGNNYTNAVGAAANNYGNNTFYAKTGGTISGDVVITGNITISGTQTFANTQTLLIGDNILTLNADLPLSVAPTENAGIEVNRGNKSSNAQLIWIETANAWGFTSNSQNAITTYIASNTLVETYAVAGNNYTILVGAASNTWANTLSTADRAIANAAANSSNAYIITVGAASNTWANTIATAGNNYISSTIYPAINAARVNVSSTAPASPSQGSLWWHKDYGRLFVYYTDEDATSQWVDSTIGIGNPVITDDFVSGNTNNTFYLTFIANTSGTMQTAFVSSGKLTFNSNTGILSATEFNSLSDLNRKTNIAPIQDAIDKITKLDGVTFNWKDNGKPSAGIIAQQLQEVMPELVSSDMSVNYSGIIGLLVECIKELNNKLPK